MIRNFKQFVPSSVCLKCDGCCRFKETDSRWRPYMAESERKEAAKPGLVDQIFAKHIVGQDSRINVLPCGESHICHFLNPKDNTCGIYHARPFECQLYPFLLGKEGDQLVVYAHLNCPHIQEHGQGDVYNAYVQYLQEFLKREDVQGFLQQNPEMIADYSVFRDELTRLFTRPLKA